MAQADYVTNAIRALITDASPKPSTNPARATCAGRAKPPAPPNGGRKRGEAIFTLDGAAFEAGGLPRPRFHR